MNISRRRIAVGTIFALIFIGLFLFRIDFFSDRSAPLPSPDGKVLKRPASTWMNVYQKGRRIGVVSRQFTAFDNGFITQEQISLQLAVLGVTQVLNVSTETQFGPDMTLSAFDTHIYSGLFRYQARGLVSGDKLIVFAGIPGSLKKMEIAVRNIPLLSGHLYDAAYLYGLEKGNTRNYSVFDPSTLGTRDIPVTRESDEVIRVMGKRVLTSKYCADFMGAVHCAWLSADGEVLRETGIMGLSMEKVSAETAQKELSPDGADFTQIASIVSNRVIENPRNLRRLIVKLDGISPDLPDLEGGRQRLSPDGRLTIERENLSAQRLQTSEDWKLYLSSTPLVQSNHPKIRAQADRIVSPTDKPDQKLSKIVLWVYKNIRKQPVLSVPNALEVLDHKAGDCNEHAVLTAALLRAAGIPAKIETGLTYLEGRFYYHAWNSAYIGHWITVDSVFNQIPADVTHIRLASGEGSQQLDLLGVMGNIQLEILDLFYD